jgi:tetratricopeptide (TPR) repeat protein
VNFNAREALKEGEAELAKKNKDNYIATLPIYYYPAKSDLSSAYPSLDLAITKASKSIYKHSMMFRGKEYVRTMDDTYLLMGKAYFYKQEYRQALRIFNYMSSTYKEKKWNCREEAMIWNVRTNIRLGYYSTALASLDEIQYELMKKKSPKLKAMYHAAAAEYQLTAPDGDISVAIDYIQEAIRNHPKRAFKTRLYFILGQLYENTEHFPEARRCFQKVIGRTPPYDMEFSAVMHLATNYDGTAASKGKILKALHRMLEEKKNLNYKDQIYYAMAKMGEIDEDTSDVIKNLVLSVASYQDNDYQRTFSSVKLGDLLFNQEQYIEAQAYYDTATLSLPGNYPGREAVIEKGNVLRSLVENLNVVTEQDSLQRIAKMSDAERNQWVQKMIAAYTEAERKAQEEEANRMAALASTAGMANINTQSSNGKWYFYNQSLVTSGMTEFYRYWGNRKLEDNWRISNKQQISFDELSAMNDPNATNKTDSVEYDEDGNPIVPRESDPKKPAYYTQDLPLTPAAMDSSNKMVINAMYQAGMIYTDQLKDLKHACETFEKLVARYPDNDLCLPSLYMLYRNYQSMENAKALIYKEQILSKYPDSEYAQIIKDPDYFKKIAEKEQELTLRYETVYEAYTNKQWSTVIAMSTDAIQVCPDIVLKSKYDYLRTVALGQQMGTDTLRAHLKQLKTDYEGLPVATLAEIYLSTLPPSPKNQQLSRETGTSSMDFPSGKSGETMNMIGSFENHPLEMHYIILILNVDKLAVMDVKNKVSNFNAKYFSLQKFNVNSFYISKNEQMITVSKFNGKDKSMDYYHAISGNDYFKELVRDGSLVIYAIAATNYTTYYNTTADRPAYKDFFEKFYLEKK